MTSGRMMDISILYRGKENHGAGLFGCLSGSFMSVPIYLEI
jgi:hypothetical protein